MKISKKTAAHHIITLFFLLGTTTSSAMFEYWFTKNEKMEQPNEKKAFFSQSASFKNIGTLIGKIDRREKKYTNPSIFSAAFYLSSSRKNAKKEADKKLKELNRLGKNLKEFAPATGTLVYHLKQSRKDISRMAALYEVTKNKKYLIEFHNTIAKKLEPFMSGKLDKSTTIRNYDLNARLGNELEKQKQALKKLTKE